AKLSAATDSNNSKRDTARAASEPKATKEKSEGKYTLQVAAYKSKADAEALVKRLKARRLDARVIATTKLYRVRIGHYKTHAAAVAEQQELKKKKIATIVTDTDDEQQ